MPAWSNNAFLWGVATSGYQSEGGYNGPDEPKNNWFHSETHGNVMPTGKAAEFWSRYEEDFHTCQQMGLNAFRMSLEWARIQPSTSAEPVSAPPFDVAALDAYSDRIAACRRAGLEPIVTLHHFTHPAWLGIDAWLHEETVACFVEYVQVSVTHINRRLTDYHQLPPIRWYITTNEPNILVPNTYLSGMFPAGTTRGLTPFIRAYNLLLAAHIHAYNLIHDIYEEAGWEFPQVSLNTYCSDLYWSEKMIWDVLSLRQQAVKFTELQDYACANAKQFEVEISKANLPFRHNLPYRFGQLARHVSNWLGRRNFDVSHLSYCLQVLEASPRLQVFDYLALDYYDPFLAHIFRLPLFSDFEFKTKDFRGWLMSGITSKWWDWRSLPEGLHFFCQFYSREFGSAVGQVHCPVLIAENGMAIRRKPDNSIATRRSDQMLRSEYLKAHVYQVKRLVQEGIPMLGYLHWSMTDNYEWGSYTPRFGLFSIDFAQGSNRLVEDHLGDRPSETYTQLIREFRNEFTELSRIGIETADVNLQ
ncbi:beta-glucosidase/6-phospho-beta-glucosidase/beta-galactosidase [Leptolyngbyaceae cyanobacterium JSC-12]|nr:beta-glucosidase/6-phospho-beta-glucosidase/beta-galactosidase [Leptolyngbyaceae cyanobacterium JSC-12]